MYQRTTFLNIAWHFWCSFDCHSIALLALSCLAYVSVKNIFYYNKLVRPICFQFSLQIIEQSKKECNCS